MSGPSSDREVYVGWDNALQTYFAQVIDGTDQHGEDILTVDLGNDVNQVTDAAEVIEALRPYAEIPDELPALLERSRTADRSTVTDLRSLTPAAARQELRDIMVSYLDKPRGYVTPLERADVAEVLAVNGWDLATMHAMDGGHAETYVRGEQELEIRWGWSTDDNAPRLLSPVHLDGQGYGVDSVQQLADLSTERGSEAEPLTQSGEGRVDQQLDQPAGLEGSHWHGLEEGHLNDTLFGDEGFHSSLGY
nr:hypothetical protein GCM10017745_46300 [Saccharothrix mutabilis subsp. capreolus]